MEPDLSPKVCAALLVTETGIVDSASLVDSLAREIEEADYLETSSTEGVSVGVGLAKGGMDRGEGVVVPGTRVVRIDPADDGWVVQMETGWEGLSPGETGDIEAVKAQVVVNAAGLNSASLVEQLVPESQRTGVWISKGESWQNGCAMDLLLRAGLLLSSTASRSRRAVQGCAVVEAFDISMVSLFAVRCNHSGFHLGPIALSSPFFTPLSQRC